MSVKKKEQNEPDAIKDVQKGLAGKRCKFAAWEDEIIKQNWQTMTDEELAKKCNRDPIAIAKRRKRLGFMKPNGRPANDTRKEGIFANPSEYSLAALSKEDRIQFYKTQFESNFRYENLKKILMQDELEYYKRKYIEFLDAIDTITLQEEDLLHNMIMTEIQMLRVQIQIKDSLEAYNSDDEDDKRPPPQFLYKDLNEMEKRYVDYQEKLNLTREQRLKSNREEKINISSIVRSLLDRRNREEAGKTAGVMSFFAAQARNDMNKMKYLLGE
jgi:hypothetical protein